MIVEGEDAIFSVVATGAGTVRNQWFVDNNAIIGETSDTLILDSVELSDSSTTYPVDVTDDNGTLRSDHLLDAAIRLENTKLAQPDQIKGLHLVVNN